MRMQYTSLTVSLALVFICLSRVEAAGRAFPIESENYITERFHRINSRLVTELFYTLIYRTQFHLTYVVDTIH